MNVVVSIAPRTMEEALSRLDGLRQSPDLVEIRVDSMADLDLERLLRPPRPAVIITNRRRDEGGAFRGSAEEQVSLLSSALRLGAEYVDIELRWGMPRIRRLLSAVPRARLIVSHHIRSGTPPHLFPLLRRLRATPGHILKLVTSANDITDNRRLFDLLDRAGSSAKPPRRAGARRPIAAFCMGERGEISRILGGKHGCALTYAAGDAGTMTAPGQLPAPDLKQIYRVHRINRRTRVFGLAGNPVSYSRGYLYHNSIFARKSLNAVYVNFRIDDLPPFLTAFRDEISGLSVTMPFKEEMIPLLDRVDDDATLLRSVNTVVKRRGLLWGYNTDVAAVRALLPGKAGLRGKVAVILGTGSTAATIAYVAIGRGARTTIAGRSARKAKALAERLGCAWASLDDLSRLGADLIANATPVGMAPASSLTLVPRALLRPGVTVFDAVYNPPVTRLLEEARAAGCRTIAGTEMFREQARLQSKLFLGEQS